MRKLYFMKIKFLIITLILFLKFLDVKSQKISFIESEHDFGQIDENGGSVSYTFEFSNEGTLPLVILSVKPSCGCTTPDWSKNPIKPGNKGFIVAEYNPKGRPGIFRKSLAVISNSETNSEKISSSTYIYIKGKVNKE